MRLADNLEVDEGNTFVLRGSSDEIEIDQNPHEASSLTAQDQLSSIVEERKDGLPAAARGGVTDLFRRGRPPSAYGPAAGSDCDTSMHPTTASRTAQQEEVVALMRQVLHQRSDSATYETLTRTANVALSDVRVEVKMRELLQEGLQKRSR